MKIKSSFINRSGQTLEYTYHDLDSFEELNDKKVKGVHGFCFCGDKLVIVYSESKGYWTPPGGGVKQDETVEEAVVREILEETNMRILKQKAIGYIEISERDGSVTTQTRAMCIVEPIGPFIADADHEGDITEIKLIDPKNIKQYFDWGEVSDHVLTRALELKNSL